MQLVDVLREAPDRVDALPSGDWVGSNDRMGCSQLSANVLRAASWFLVDGGVLRIVRSCFEEAVADVRRSETFEELLICRREAITAAGGKRGQSERGIVCRARFELNVGMPLRGVVSSLCGVSLITEHLLPCD